MARWDATGLQSVWWQQTNAAWYKKYKMVKLLVIHFRNKKKEFLEAFIVSECSQRTMEQSSFCRLMCRSLRRGLLWAEVWLKPIPRLGRRTRWRSCPIHANLSTVERDIVYKYHCVSDSEISWRQLTFREPTMRPPHLVWQILSRSGSHPSSFE